MIWLAVIGVSVGAAGALFWYACTVPSSQVFGPALVRGPAEGRRVALTFDDGPTSPFTEQILDILRDRKVRATFFVCGKNVERFPEIAQRIHAEGHTLGNHTYSHPFPFFSSQAEIAQEIDRTQEAIQKITGYRPNVFRPPYGIRWFGLYPALRERGIKLIQWSDAGYDWKYRTDAIVRATLKGLGPGSVVVLHDGHEPLPPGKVDQSNTVNALPAIIDGALKAEYCFVPIQDFLSEM